MLYIDLINGTPATMCKVTAEKTKNASSSAAIRSSGKKNPSTPNIESTCKPLLVIKKCGTYL